MKKYITIIAAAIALTLAFSCKKDDDSSVTYDYLDGGMGIIVDPFVDGVDSVRVTAFGVSHPEGNPLRYYFKVSGIEDAGDTVTVASNVRKTSFNRRFKMPAEPGTYTVTCGAMASGYYSTTATADVVLVHPNIGESLTGTGIEPTDDHISLTFDYYYKQIGSLDWMRNNFAEPGVGLVLENCDVTAYPYGRYYTYTEAMSVCPEGWRLPTVQEWTSLSDKAGDLTADARFNGNRMWPVAELNRTNSTGISAIPSGYATKVGDGSRFSGLNDYAVFWTSDTTEDGEHGLYVYLIGSSDEIYTAAGDKTFFSASVRCVR